MIPRTTTLKVMVLLPALVWLYGWRTIDLVEWRTITAAPFAVSLDPSQQFLYGSPFTFLLGSYYQHQGLGDAQAFVLVHGIGLALLAVAVVRWLARRGGAGEGSAALLVLAGSPLLFVVLTWLGKSDAYLLAFYLLLLTSASRMTQAALCVLMMACHRELAVVMLAGHMLVRGNVAAILPGLAAGAAASFAFTYGVLDLVPASRMDFALAHAGTAVATVVSHPLTHLFATLGPFWLYVARPSAVTVARLVVLAAAAVLASLTYDFTRVCVLAAAPLLLVVAEEAAAEIGAAGGLSIGGHRVGRATLALLALGQVQVAGAKVLWVRGLEWALAR